MSKDLEFETYLNISPRKLGIYLFDIKNQKNLYKEELIIDENNNSNEKDILKKFLDDNIFKIEKLSRNFIENIILIIDNENIFNLQIGIKKKNYNSFINNEYLKNYLTEAKDLFKENYQNEKIMHIIINKYTLDGKSYHSLDNNLECKQLGLEIQFKSISSSYIYDLDKILENYQIKIIKYLDGSYIRNFFKENIGISEMTYKILTGYNKNEVMVIPKNLKKPAFFERFFQLFS